MIIISCGKFSQLCHSKLCTPLRGGRQATQVFVAKMQVARNMNTEARITMGNNGKKTEEKRRNYWIIGVVLASSVILLYILIYLLHVVKTCYIYLAVYNVLCLCISRLLGEA